MKPASRRLRVLWVTNTLLPEAASFVGRSLPVIGGWMPSLAAALVDGGEVDLGVATMLPGGMWEKHTASEVQYYVIPSTKTADHRPPSPRLLGQFSRVLTDFEPDIIHVHGTEYSHGLLALQAEPTRPVVVSIQGLVSEIQKHLSGGLTPIEILRSRSLRDLLRLDGVWEQRIRWAQRVAVERSVLAATPAVIGRTLWDRAHVKALNPGVLYYHCDELLRPEFYERCWQPDALQNHTIFVASAQYPYKGFHWLVRAVSLLQHEFPEIRVRVAIAGLNVRGHRRPAMVRFKQKGYDKYLESLVRSLRLEARFEVLGALSAAQMADELASASVFVLPSMIENSPNALAEAMLVGTPTVSSFVGGVPSMATNGVTTLSFPSGDWAVLAECVRRVLIDNELAGSLSEQAREVALRRHDRSGAAARIVEIYREILARMER